MWGTLLILHTFYATSIRHFPKAFQSSGSSISTSRPISSPQTSLTTSFTPEKTMLEEYWETPVTVGQWGGKGGHAWDDGHFGAIKQIIVGHGGTIDSIQVEYDVDGRSVLGNKHGGNGGRIVMINFSYPDEYLISIIGYVGDYHFPTIIRSLTFETNIRTYGPYGEERGMQFKFPAMGGKITSFYGKSGEYLDSIGVHYRPLKIIRTPSPLESLIPALERLAKETADKEVAVTVKVRIGLNN